MYVNDDEDHEMRKRTRIHLENWLPIFLSCVVAVVTFHIRPNFRPKGSVLQMCVYLTELDLRMQLCSAESATTTYL